jgi:hypothetical protein
MEPSGTSQAVIDEPNTQSAPICSTCPHPVDTHDPIAARYCAATLNAAVTRGCICK